MKKIHFFQLILLGSLITSNHAMEVNYPLVDAKEPKESPKGKIRNVKLTILINDEEIQANPNLIIKKVDQMLKETK